MPILDEAFFRSCQSAGAALDLSGCVYGPSHSGGAFASETPRYYRCLAGLVQQLELSTIAELGTHHGGSVQALIAGLVPSVLAKARVATVDVTRLNREQLERHAMLTLVQGDSLDPAVVAQMTSTFDGHIDLLFVDTIHSFGQTLENTAVYANRLKPRFILFDDIHLNPDMRRFWSWVGEQPCGRTWDLTAASERTAAGLGLLECRYPYHWPESSPRLRAAKRVAFDLRLRTAGLLSHETKDRLRRLLGQPTVR